MFQVLFLMLTWISAFVMMISLIATIYLWANGHRTFRMFIFSVIFFAISLIGLVIFS
ncbi:hypothetical protein G7081_07450 [Vagococcus coleopterorum]|uniref:DUF2768 domain-containing protein n=1 Tax=Vagococcus coleopterorum TaxID=2714946 RepID=A0A6G8APC0_9ENTE|nr:hypothetical protein [Vagococcus coleopterorum]QIL46921.1 hypothetical protein G7081_07450 [Vagococcus coleopterorum]